MSRYNSQPRKSPRTPLSSKVCGAAPTPLQPWSQRRLLWLVKIANRSTGLPVNIKHQVKTYSNEANSRDINRLIKAGFVVMSQKLGHNRRGGQAYKVLQLTREGEILLRTHNLLPSNDQPNDSIS